MQSRFLTLLPALLTVCLPGVVLAQSGAPPTAAGASQGASASQDAGASQGGNASSPPLQQVVVTAGVLRDTPLQDVPASVTVLDSATLAAAGEQHFEDVLGLVPNLDWSGDTNRPRYFQIRGIGELDQYTGAPNPSIGFLIDDIDFSGLGTAATLFDVDSIEVLRGPQGTRYGANALGGLIAVQSAAPADTFGGSVEVGGGDYDTQSYGAVVTGPVQDLDSAFRLAVQRYTSDGYYHNAYLDRDATDGDNELTLRGRWRFQPSDSLRVDLTLLDIRIDDGYDAWSVDDTRTTLSDQPGRDAQYSQGAALHLDYSDLGPATLTFIATAADSNIHFSYDSDFGNPVMWAPYTYAYSDDQARDRDTQSLELRLANTAPAAVNWLIGLYGLDLSEALTDTEPGIYLDPYDPTQDSQSLQVTTSHFFSRNAAVFGQLDGLWGRHWKWILGGRAERRSADYQDVVTNLGEPDLTHAFAPVEHLWGGNASLQYLLDADRNLYLTVGRGYKAGGFNLGPGLPANQILFNPESDLNTELGYKAELLDHRLRLDADVFYMRRTDLQLQTGEQLVPDNPTSFILYTMNAPSGRNYGLEADLAWGAMRVLDVGASLGLLNTAYHGLTYYGQLLPDRALPDAPSWQGSLSATLHGRGGTFVRADVTGRGSFYYDLPALDPYSSHAYVLLNLKAGVQRGAWSVEAWMRNVTDRSYAVRGFYFGDVPPDFNYQQFVQLGEPRTFGGTVRYSF
ncbi:MAG TPA: TonB-dependent receptor [Steroidobacteraceae bacterium]|nr:TonB-dependent receptor [Steroidobacteraceae bacterium]